MRRKYLAAAIGGAACLGLALPASAQDDEMMMPSLSMSGSTNQDIGFGNWIGTPGGQAEAQDALHFETNASIAFAATGTTDGGLSVAVRIAMDGDTAGIDEANLTIGGSFGSIVLGSDDNAGNAHGNKGIGKGYAGTGYYDGGQNYTPAGSPGPIPNSDSVGIRYSSPVIGGLQAGLSLQPDASDADQKNDTSNDQHVVAFGANYSGDFGGVALTFGINHVTQKPVSAASPGVGASSAVAPSTAALSGVTRRSWGAGVTVAIGDTALNFRYDEKGDTHFNGAHSNHLKYVTGSLLTPDTMDRGGTRSMGMGVDHTIGALTFGVGYGVSVAEDSTAEYDDYDDNVPDGTTSKQTAVLSAGAEYDLGGGVKVSGAITRGEVTDAAGSAACYTMAGTTVDANDNASAALTGTGRINLTGKTCPAGSAYATPVVSMDDVGVGLRIAFSF